MSFQKPLGQESLFDVPDYWWRHRLCTVCGCALSVTYHHTYVVQRQWWLKIGATNLPKRRINELSRPAWRRHILYPEGMDWTEPLVPLFTLAGDIEHQMHEWFREYHAIGEWFDLNDTTRAWLEEVKEWASPGSLV